MTDREKELERQLADKDQQIAQHNIQRRRQSDEDIADIKLQLNSLASNCALIPDLKKAVNHIQVTLNGTPEAPEKGLKVRMDRIEQTETSRTWFGRTVVGASVVALVASGIAYFKTQKGP